MTVERLFVVLVSMGIGSSGQAAPPQGYYRQPAIHGDTIVFVAEGDLWKVTAAGGVATRLTTHHGDETSPAISPDGRIVAFSAQYEGPTEVYTMSLSGGPPTRRTFEGGPAGTVGFARGDVGEAHRLIYATARYSTLPATQLLTIDLATGAQQPLPLYQASDGVYDDLGATLYFVRFQFQGSQTKRYKGGTIQQLWKWTGGTAEATPLTADYPGTSREPMWFKGRVYFASDRDGTMNIWSIAPDGADARQHTHHAGWDVLGPSLTAEGGGRIAYQLGADLRLLELSSGEDRLVPITLDSDFDQMRERWVEKPMEWVTSAHVSPDGDRVVLTARGAVFVAPHRQGRLVEVAPDSGVRARDARFMPDGKSLLVMTDQSGEVEFWTMPANGVGKPEQLSSDGTVLRWQGVPSPDGKLIAHTDKNQRLWVLDVGQKTSKLIEESAIGDLDELAWSGDSRWLAYVSPAPNTYRVVKLYNAGDGSVTPITTDRFDSYSPAWSRDGKWIYLLSDRNLESLVSSPWGPLQPEPYFDRLTRIYHIPLQAGLRSPFAPRDELAAEEKKVETDDKANGDKGPKPDRENAGGAGQPGAEQPDAPEKPEEKGAAKKVPEVVIEPAGIAERLLPVPVPEGNYASLSTTEKTLLWIARDSGPNPKRHLQAVQITNEDPQPKTIVPDVSGYEVSLDGKKAMVRKGDAVHIIDAGATSAVDLDKKNVELSGWRLSVIPRDEWRQMFVEAWRLERDYFYDPRMHGVDWPAMRARYEPLVDRVTTRAELSDLIAQMVAELSALHIFVRGGDLRQGQDSVAPGSLGAVLVRDEARAGWRVERIYRHDPDYPERASPLRRPAGGAAPVAEGDSITAINGIDTLSVADPALLLRHTAGKQVLLRVRAADDAQRDVVVTPLSQGSAADLRYHDWEFTRRLRVEEWSNGQIGYVHLRAMGGGDFSDFARGFYPVFNRKGLIVDVRSNRGGNIDSWVLEKLMRRAWFYWSQRVGNPPSWNMQFAFRGHMAALCDERTASDGEAFSEGFRRLGLGKVIGTRTWGGEIWLSSSNVLVDRGIATAAEFGVYGPEGQWLIEGHGVEPDIVVDNLPRATFDGEDAQLRAAVDHLLQLIREKPVEDPVVPRHPDKSFRPGNR